MALGVSAYSETPFGAEPSDNTVVVSGIQSTVSLGSITITGELGVNVPLTGQSLSVTNITSYEDTLTAFAEAPFASESPSTISPVNVIATGTADIAVTGTPLNIVTGNEVPVGNADVLVTGINLTTSAGQLDAFALVEVPVTGINLTSQIGDETVTGDANVSVIGKQLNSFIGNETAFTDVDVTVTGNSLTSAIENVSITGTGNVSLTGIQLTTAVGDVDHNSTYTVSGIDLTTAIGQATADDASAEVTGVSATISTGSVNITGWSQIDPGVINVWTEVDKAA
jgi:hypothetical protein